jgi:hypothetical protein
MARRKKAKRRKTASQLSPQQHQQGAMSNSDVGSVEPDSSDGMSTDPRESEGVRTAMTSIMETDPEPGPLGVSELVVDDDSDGSEDGPGYAQSQYPRVNANHRVEYPYLNRRMERDAQTMYVSWAASVEHLLPLPTAFILDFD